MGMIGRVKVYVINEGTQSQRYGLMLAEDDYRFVDGEVKPVKAGFIEETARWKTKRGALNFAKKYRMEVVD